MTDAMPTPSPPMMRPMTSIERFGAKPVTIALSRNSTAAIFMTASRPRRSAIRPPIMAPAAAPSRAEATAKPRAAAAVLNSSSTAETAPLMTALS